jgi:hypothetical protein
MQTILVAIMASLILGDQLYSGGYVNIPKKKKITFKIHGILQLTYKQNRVMF